RLAAHDPARQRADLVRLAADDDRVPRGLPALVAAHDVGVLREQVDDLPLPFVAPLRPDDDGRRHPRSLGGGFGGRRCGSLSLDPDGVAAAAEEGAAVEIQIEAAGERRALLAVRAVEARALHATPGAKRRG